MNISVNEIYTTSDDEIFVLFSFKGNVVKGIWKRSSIPHINDNVSIELDINIKLALGHNTKIICSKATRGNYLKGKNIITAICEDIDDDGMLYLRICSDCLVMAECQNNLNKGCTLEIEISPEYLEIW